MESREEKPILVTPPELPPLEEFHALLKDIWSTRWLTNYGKYHQAMKSELASFLDAPYIHPSDGHELFYREEFSQTGIHLQFLRNNLNPYSQRRNAFEPRLSIIDTMMFCSPSEIKGLVSNSEIFE